MDLFFYFISTSFYNARKEKNSEVVQKSREIGGSDMKITNHFKNGLKELEKENIILVMIYMIK